MSGQKNDFTSGILAIAESIIASYLYGYQDKKARAACFNKVDTSTLIHIKNSIKDKYEKEHLHSYITQDPLLPNSRYPFISDEAKSNFIQQFYHDHPDLTYIASEKVNECLGKYVDEINKFLNDTLSADGKFLAKRINDTEAKILSAIDSLPHIEEQDKSISSPQFYRIGARNKLFSGRTQEIDDIMLKLNADKIVFLTGKGGIGKLTG